jgi:hypothetical protein
VASPLPHGSPLQIEYTGAVPRSRSGDARIRTSGAFSGSREKIMAKRKVKQERRSVVLEPNAAGIDNGVEEIYVAVPDP